MQRMRKDDLPGQASSKPDDDLLDVRGVHPKAGKGKTKTPHR